MVWRVSALRPRLVPVTAPLTSVWGTSRVRDTDCDTARCGSVVVGGDQRSGEAIAIGLAGIDQLEVLDEAEAVAEVGAEGAVVGTEDRPRLAAHRRRVRHRRRRDRELLDGEVGRRRRRRLRDAGELHLVVLGLVDADAELEADAPARALVLGVLGAHPPAELGHDLAEPLGVDRRVRLGDLDAGRPGGAGLHGGGVEHGAGGEAAVLGLRRRDLGLRAPGHEEDDEGGEEGQDGGGVATHTPQTD